MLCPGQYEDLSATVPNPDDLRFGEADGQVTMAPSFVPLLSSDTVVDPLQNTPHSFVIHTRSCF